MVMVKLSYRINLSWPFRPSDLLILLGNYFKGLEKLFKGAGWFINIQQYNSLLGNVGKGGREGRKGMANLPTPHMLNRFLVAEKTPVNIDPQNGGFSKNLGSKYKI